MGSTPGERGVLRPVEAQATMQGQRSEGASGWALFSRTTETRKSLQLGGDSLGEGHLEAMQHI